MGLVDGVRRASHGQELVGDPDELVVREGRAVTLGEPLSAGDLLAHRLVLFFRDPLQEKERTAHQNYEVLREVGAGSPLLPVLVVDDLPARTVHLEMRHLRDQAHAPHLQAPILAIKMRGCQDINGKCE